MLRCSVCARGDRRGSAADGPSGSLESTLESAPAGGGGVSRIEPIAVENAEGTARELLDEVARHGGKPGPMTRAMANAPALLKGYVDLSRAMKRTNIDRRIVERIN